MKWYEKNLSFTLSGTIPPPQIHSPKSVCQNALSSLLSVYYEVDYVFGGTRTGPFQPYGGAVAKKGHNKMPAEIIDAATVS